MKKNETPAEIVDAFSLPEKFKKLGTREILAINTTVLQGGSGPLKVKRKPKAKALTGKIFTVCTVCETTVIYLKCCSDNYGQY